METSPPATRDPSGPLLAAGVILTSVGGLLFVIASVAVLGSLVTGDYEERTGYFIAGIVMIPLGGAQVWAGILAILRRRSGKTMGLVVSWLSVALGITGIVESFVAEDALGDLIPSILLLGASIAAVILLMRGQPRG